MKFVSITDENEPTNPQCVMKNEYSGVIIRKAAESDIDSVVRIYNNVHTSAESGLLSVGWVRGVYPTEKTAEEALCRGDLFVEEYAGDIVGTAVINSIQPDIYKKAQWRYDCGNGGACVLHTLATDPAAGGKGFGRKFVEFYENYAKKCGYTCVRMDTNEINLNARRFYKNLGYEESGIFECEFNSIPGVKLVMLEKKLK